MDLLIVRHAVAHEPDPERWPNDADRPLTDDGERSFEQAAAGLASLTGAVGRVLASPYARAWRTAEILHEAAGFGAPKRFAPLAADKSPEEVIEALAAREPVDRLVLVGHEPMLSRLCGILAGGLAPELKKGAVARLAVEQLAPGGATLRWLLPPKVLRRLGR